MRLGLSLALTVAVLPAPGVALAQSADQRIGAELRRDPVFVERGADPGLSRAEARRIRARIRRRGEGRLRVVVAKESTAEALGGIGAFANLVAQAAGKRGTLLATAGSGFHVVVTYPRAEAAVEALRAAAEEHQEEGLGAQLLDAVGRLAAIDPGAAADPAPPPGAPPPVPPPGQGFSSDEITDDFFDTVRLGFVIVAAAIALPILLLLLRAGLRARRRRAEAEEVLTEDREAAREQLVALGDDIRALDFDVSVPGADVRGKTAYEAALAQYERADRELTAADNRRRLDKATATLAEGRRLMEEAKRRLGSQPLDAP